MYGETIWCFVAFLKIDIGVRNPLSLYFIPFGIDVATSYVAPNLYSIAENKAKG